ncbi:MAG: class II fructose-bisphosphatase [Thermomicrobiales bacterium]
MDQFINRSFALELVRVTEAAALQAGRWMGRGQKNLADKAAVDAMRMVLNTIPMDGMVVIGEGTKDQAPMLYEGEFVGSAPEPKTDIAVDPIDGTRLLSQGMAGSIATLAVSERGTMYESPYVVYMDKIVVGAAAAGSIDINASVDENIRRVAAKLNKSINDVTVILLDRPRHTEIAEQIRASGARIRFIMDGDVAGAVMAATPGTGIDILMGIGGAPEAVVAACALRCLGGEIQCKLWPRNDEERSNVLEAGIDIDAVLNAEDLVSGDDVFFAATGITDGDFLKGVRYLGDMATTQSVVMRSRSGTVRWVEAQHPLSKLEAFRSIGN